MTVRELRPYQSEAVDAVRADWGNGITRPAVVLPTGTGKTDVIAKIGTDLAAQGGRVLAIAHRTELLDQISARFRMHSPGARVGRVQGQTTQRGHLLTTAMVPTLAARVRSGAERKLPAKPDLVIVDECHHAAADSYLSVLEWAGVLDGSVPALGLTATLVRADKRGLGDVWESVAYSRDIAWAIEQGYLVRPRGRVVVVSHLDLNRAKVTAGDYQDGELGDMITQDTDEIVKAWTEHAGLPDGSHRRTIAFTPNVGSAEVLCEEFRSAGVSAAVVTGAMKMPERNKIYADLAAGVLTVLVGVMVMTEGWDCPPVECVLMARPTRQAGLYQQIVGRGLRLSPETGKTECLVLDVVGASRTQRLTTLADLSPTSEYDATEIDDLPCDACGGWVSKAAALRQTGEPDGLCTCVPEQGERDPDGGRRRLQGPAQYEDLDLIMQTSGAVWLQTYAGTPILPAGKRTAILWRNPETDLYTAGHMANRGRRDGAWLHEQEEPLTVAMALAERWAYAQDGINGADLSSRNASWRAKGGRPSEAQVGMAASLGIDNPEQYNRARLSDEITIAITSERLDRI